MEEALKKAWLMIPTSFFESLIESMERRIEACYPGRWLAYKVLRRAH